MPPLSERPSGRRSSVAGPARLVLGVAIAATLILVADTGWRLVRDNVLADPSGPTAVTVVTPVVPAAIALPGPSPALPWPKTGQGAALVIGIGQMSASPGEIPIPIASVTKMMTALVVIRDHPMAPSQAGPSVSISARDVADFERDVTNGDSSVEVKAGTRLTERQLLEALLIPSADNIADRLAIWDAGSIPAFVAKMNATAAALGLVHTHYADASGLDPRSVSTAADQALLARVFLANQTLAGIVDEGSAALPVVGTVSGYNPLLGTDGVIGIKSGFTDKAQACLVVAARRVVGGHDLVVVAVTLGQPDGLPGAAKADRAILDAASSRLRAFQVLAPRQPLGTVSVPGDPRPVALTGPPQPTDIVGWAGLVLETTLTESAPDVVSSAGTVVATLEVSGSQGAVAFIPLRLGEAFAPSARGAAAFTFDALAPGVLRGELVSGPAITPPAPATPSPATPAPGHAQGTGPAG